MKTTRTTTADFILHDVMLGTVILTLLVHFKRIGSKNTVGQDSVTSLQYEVRF